VNFYLPRRQQEKSPCILYMNAYYMQDFMVPASSESVSALLWGQHCVTYHQYVTCDDWQTSYAVCRTICWLHWHSEKTFSFIAMQKTLSYIHAYIHLYTGSTSTVFQLFQVFLLQTDARLNTYIDKTYIYVLWGAEENGDVEVKWLTAPTVDDDTASKFAKLANASSALTQCKLSVLQTTCFRKEAVAFET